ncbi:hypothetical protein Hanom_Chr10g00872471 [Helianthus anomalus]
MKYQGNHQFKSNLDFHMITSFNDLTSNSKPLPDQIIAPDHLKISDQCSCSTRIIALLCLKSAILFHLNTPLNC